MVMKLFYEKAKLQHIDLRSERKGILGMAFRHFVFLKRISKKLVESLRLLWRC